MAALVGLFALGLFKIWAMGCSASNAASDLTAQAKAHASAREGIIMKEAEAYAERTGKSLDEAVAIVRDTVAGARRRIDLAGGSQHPNLADHGVASPVLVNGEIYGSTGVEYLAGGDRIIHASRPIGGGRFSHKRIIQRIEGSERTRVISEARG